MKLAVFLLAGGGIRLKPYTNDIPKCLVKVNGKPLLTRMLDYLVQGGIEKVIMVVGYKGNMIKDVVGSNWQNITVEYVNNADWASTNNVVSLDLALPNIDQDFILLEGDLIFTWLPFSNLFKPDHMAISNYRPHMSGTLVDIDENSIVKEFLIKKNLTDNEKIRLYKTVNIYSFRYTAFNDLIVPHLEKLINSGQKQVYYEQAIANAVAEKQYKITAINFDGTPWYEIDTEEDLLKAEDLFLETDI